MADARSFAPGDEAVAVRSQPSPDEIAAEGFDEEQVKPSRNFIVELLARSPRRLTWVARFLPILFRPAGFSAVVWRYDDVREVLSRDEQFPVSWGERMIEVTQGTNFLLGMARGAEYSRSYEEIAKAFPLAEVPVIVEPKAAEFAKAALDEKVGLIPKGGSYAEIDAVEELIAMVPARLCDSYFGVRMGDQKKDRIRFAKATYALSSYVFDVENPSSFKTLGSAAAAYLRKTIRDSIAGARRQRQKDTALQHMIDAGLSDDAIHAHLFGMISGYIPTNVMAGANVLETLLRRPAFLERARDAALADDDRLLWRCLREALRFRHINPGAYRICPLGYTLGEGGPSPTRIAPGSRVLALIQTAMFDSSRIERPYDFNPNRGDENYMVFGFGQHWCIGFYIARATMVQSLKPLLRCKHLAMAVRNPPARMQRFNKYTPLHMEVAFVP